MKKRTLNEWLDEIKSDHVVDMDLSLERVNFVAQQMGVTKFDCPVIVIGGTNGKGSTVAGIESIYRTQGYKVGAFTSPILFRHNEYIRIDGTDITDELLCEAYEVVYAKRGATRLTPFEFTTLAALELFKKADLDVCLLEVGLGGRFDSVNVVESDLAIITSIGLDHTAWLGDTREKIGFEKAGIFKEGKPAVCGDIDPPVSIIEYAKKTHSSLYLQKKDFSYLEQDNTNTWNWWNIQIKYEQLPRPNLLLQNMSTVLEAVSLLQEKLPVSEDNIRQGLATVSLPGRMEKIQKQGITHIFDVSHNPDAILLLRNHLKENHCAGKTYAVFSMLSDKDILQSIKNIQDVIDYWAIGDLECERATTISELTKIFEKAEVKEVKSYETVVDAYKNTIPLLTKNDRLIVFGSFKTVAQVR